MRKLYLANLWNKWHATNENEQLQSGLARAGWTLVGFGYGDGCTHVPTLLARHKPDAVFVSDMREWREDSFARYDPRVTFRDYECLGERPDVFKIMVAKDAGSMIEFQRKYAETIGADALLNFYHAKSVMEFSPWMAPYTKVRTYHTVDPSFIKTLDLARTRLRGIVSGAASPVYPLRQLAMANYQALDIDLQLHPGYDCGGSRTNDYLWRLSQYKTHVACASRFGFALRKIIESVAVGCVPITDLPAYDALPEIDDALVRVPTDIGVRELRGVISKAEAGWTLDRAMHFAGKAWAFYDWREMGRRLDANLVAPASPAEVLN